jgi:predicted permease
MRLLNKLLLGVRALFRKKQVEQEMDEELRSYLDAAAKEKMRSGMSYKEALRAARVEVGSMETVKEEIRSAGWESALEALWQDIRYGLRQLRRSPGLTAVIVFSLTLGIGANTAVFTLMDAVMLKMLPIKDPQRLVLFGWISQGESFDVTTSGYGLANPQQREGHLSFAFPFVEQLGAQSKVFSSVFGFVPMGWSKESVVVNIDGQASMTDAVMVTGDYFSGLGVVPVAGRAITDADVKVNAPRVALISYAYWTRQFARSPAAVGKAMFLNGVPFTIVGVVPRGFLGVQPGQAPDMWIPLVQEAKLVPWGASSQRGHDYWTRPDWWWVMIMARLKPGVSEEQALAAAKGPFLQSVMAAAKKGFKAVDAPELVCLPAGRGLDMMRQWLSRPLWILMGVVGLVLLIACANVAALLLARATARQREIGVRLAIGASRWRLIRQLLTESILFSAMGGILGLLFAHWGSRLLLALMSGDGQSLDLGARPDLPVLGFCAGVSILTGILFGLAPAIRATRVDVVPTLKQSARGLAILGTHFNLGRALVTVQVALSLLLLVGAGLFVRTLLNLENQDLGFNRQNLLMFAIDPTKSGYEGLRILSLSDKVRERLQAVPGAQAVTYSELALLTGWMNNSPIAIEGYPAKSGQDMGIEWDAVGPGFFETMGIRLLLGRVINRRDTSNSPRIAVVNEAMARHFFGDGNPIGRRFSLDEKVDPTRMFEIVGVVENANYADLHHKPFMIYIPFAQEQAGLGRMYFEVRMAGDPTAFIPTIRSATREVDPTLGLEEVKTQTQRIAEALAQERMFAELCSFFGVLALGLAGAGLYGLMAYFVSRRTNEIGIRMALGAQRKQVLYMVLRQSIGLVALGTAAGLLAAIPATKLIASELYELKATDPLTLVAGTFFLLAVAALAAYIPARRATKVDPMVALKYE